MKTFRLQTASEAICIQMPDGKEEKMEVREMTSGARDSHLNQVGNRALLNEAGAVIGVKDFEGLHSSLLARCLWRVKNDGASLVPQSEIDGWPASVTSELYTLAQTINKLTKTAEEQKGEAKNA